MFQKTKYMKLAKIIQKYPIDQRFFNVNQAFKAFNKNASILGLTVKDLQWGNDTLTAIHLLLPNTKDIHIHFGADIEDFLEELFKQKFNEQLEHLTIAYQESNKNNYFDYSKITELLSKTKFPKLKTFEYGTVWLLSNSSSVNPYIGNLSAMLNNMPKLEKLEFSGHFELSAPLNNKYLKSIIYLPNDISLEYLFGLEKFESYKYHKISQKTIDNLLLSNFQNTEEIVISTETYEEDEPKFRFPDSFFDPERFLNLKLFELDGQYNTGTKQKLSNFLTNLNVAKFFIDSIREHSKI